MLLNFVGLNLKTFSMDGMNDSLSNISTKAHTYLSAGGWFFYEKSTSRR